MSTIDAPTRPEGRDVTWRDAVTPHGRASRRRWALCYALVLVALAVSVATGRFAADAGERQDIPLILIVAPIVVFGMLRRGTRRLAALDHPSLDERDIAARNGAYRVAFPLLVCAALAGLVLLTVSAPDATRTLPAGPQSTVTTGGWFLSPDAALGLALWIAVWAVSLPTAVLAWREPDALEPEIGAPRLPEPIRDALLALTLGAALAAAWLANSDIGIVALVAVLALLGALARRTAGQAAISRQRIWRVAIGIALVLLVMAIGLAAQPGGGEDDVIEQPEPVR